MSCIYRLRRKLDLGPDWPALIETLPDEGFLIVPGQDLLALREG
jgi:DNA-binding winged helix-turn-helix (wHTH) protein